VTQGWEQRHQKSKDWGRDGWPLWGEAQGVILTSEHYTINFAPDFSDVKMKDTQATIPKLLRYRKNDKLGAKRFADIKMLPGINSRRRATCHFSAALFKSHTVSQSSELLLL
jgi:hypothetical protein